MLAGRCLNTQLQLRFGYGTDNDKTFDKLSTRFSLHSSGSGLGTVATRLPTRGVGHERRPRLEAQHVKHCQILIAVRTHGVSLWQSQ